MKSLAVQTARATEDISSQILEVQGSTAKAVEAIRRMVLAGAGVTILSDMVYRPWSLEGDKLESREISQQIPTMDVGLAWSKSAELPAPARSFIEFCRMEFLSGNPKSMTL